MSGGNRPTGESESEQEAVRRHIPVSEAVKQEYQKKLGDEFGAVFYEISNDWASALVRLKEYRVLFSDQETVKLLNAAGGAFMWDIQQILWQDLLLHVTRLTDAAKMGRHENLSVRALPPFCERPELQAKYPELHTTVQGLVETAITAAENPRDWRNRRISHTDRELALDPEAESLAPTSLRQVQAALDAVHAVIRAIANRVLEHDIGNDVIGNLRAGEFLAHLKQLVACVQYVEGIIDPEGTAPITDKEIAEGFVKRIGRHLEWNEFRQVIELREAARRFR